MIFVALDLETTGLSPDNDTIIEVAMIRFSLEKNDKKFELHYIDEKSFLVAPWIPLSEEVTLITGITDDMLYDAKKWEDLREDVREFIGGDILVGHNVLFDINMLSTHGINLEQNSVLDTFELSEFLSQDIESLNLGFLASRYNLIWDSLEHRALDDVKLSIRLFLFYIEKMEKLEEYEKSVLLFASTKEEKKSIGYLIELLGLSFENREDFLPQFHPLLVQEVVNEKNINEINSSEKPNISLVSLSWDKDEEEEMYRKNIWKGRAHIVLSSNKLYEPLKDILEPLWYTVGYAWHPEKYISLLSLEEYLHSPLKWERKITIFLVKILFWLKSTRTGLLHELKFYGEEQSFLPIFRSSIDELNIFRQNDTQFLQSVHVIVSDMYTYPHIWKSLSKPEVLFIKDILSFEDILRRVNSASISFDGVVECLSYFPDSFGCISSVRLIEWIYSSLVPRPIWLLENPPWSHGETYFLTQQEVWQRWWEKLALANEKLMREWSLISENLLSKTSSIAQKRFHTLKRYMDMLSSFHTEWWQYGCILSIQEGAISVQYIPYRIHEFFLPILSYPEKSIILSWYGIHFPPLCSFLEREFALSENLPCSIYSPKKTKWVLISSQPEMGKKTVILTTSMRHIREIGKKMKQDGYTAFIQWISGWKSKMLSLFHSSSQKSVLVWLIDTWKDELHLWSFVDTVIIAKLPFDPPTDSYFLVRTHGVSDNFSSYSQPLVAHKINTLIGRILSVNKDITIQCLDERLSETVWWRKLSENLI
jgi:DNA polymerase III epsilon subunit family exonuclease